MLNEARNWRPEESGSAGTSAMIVFIDQCEEAAPADLVSIAEISRAGTYYEGVALPPKKQLVARFQIGQRSTAVRHIEPLRAVSRNGSLQKEPSFSQLEPMMGERLGAVGVLAKSQRVLCT